MGKGFIVVYGQHLKSSCRCVVINVYSVEPSGVQVLKNPNPLKDVEGLAVKMVELLKPKQPIDSRKQPIVCFGTITEKLFYL